MAISSASGAPEWQALPLVSSVQPKNFPDSLVPPLSLPSWVLDKLGEKPKWNGEARTAEYYSKLIEPAIEGTRNDRIAALFGTCSGRHFLTA